MKKAVITILFIIITIMLQFNSGSFASDLPEKEDEVGFFGSFVLGGGVSIGRPSHLNTDSNNYLISLNERAKTKTNPIPTIDIKLGYSFISTGTSVSTSIAEWIVSNSNISVSQSLGFLGCLSIDLDRLNNDVWKDPYLIGSRRETTEVSTTCFEITYDEIFELPVTFNWGIEKTDVDNDMAGSGSLNLRRDGKVYSTGIDIPVLFWRRNSALVSYSYLDGNFKGKSNSFTGHSIALMHELDIDRWTLSTGITQVQRNYKAVHPIFNKKRKDMEYSLQSEFTYNEPFGKKGWFVNVSGEISKTDHNIIFFNESGSMIGCGVGFSF